MNDNSRPGSWSSISLSVLLHAAIVLLAVVAWFFVHKSTPRQVRLAIDATVVSAAPVKAPRPVVPAPVASAPVPDPAVEQAKEQEKQQDKIYFMDAPECAVNQFAWRVTAIPACPKTWAICVSRRREASYSKEI